MYFPAIFRDKYIKIVSVLFFSSLRYGPKNNNCNKFAKIDHLFSKKSLSKCCSFN